MSKTHLRLIAESLSAYRGSAHDDFAARTAATGILARNIGYLAEELVEGDSGWPPRATVDGVLVESVRAAAEPMSFDVAGVLVWIDGTTRNDWADPLLGSFSLTPDGTRVASYALRFVDASAGLGQVFADLQRNGRQAVERWLFEFREPPL